MEQEYERLDGYPLRYKLDGGELQVVAQWEDGEGAALRVVRWKLAGAARELYHWARGHDFAGPVVPEEGSEWVAGVALERRASYTARWDTVHRQELTGSDPAQFAARLRGWEAGLLDRAEKLLRRERRL